MLPTECVAFETCANSYAADWQNFKRLLQQAVELEVQSPDTAMEVYFRLMETYALDAGLALDCRMGAATVFFRLGRLYLQRGYAQRAANLFQLAMSMFWDTSRAENGMQCLQYELWGIRWFEDFMEVYLGHAARLQRNSLVMLPHPKHWQVPSSHRDPSLRIAVFSLCDYSVDSPMHWLLDRSRRNREAYCQRHGYGLEWTSQRPASLRSRHPVWGQLAGPLELLSGGQYDWVMSMDCDALFVNMDTTIDSLLYRFAGRETPWGKLELDPEVYFLISEDGRGLAGGNWIVSSSPRGRAFLQDIYGPEEGNPFLRHDLRDQFSLLWHLVRPGVSAPLPSEVPADLGSSAGGVVAPPRSWQDVGYIPGVHLVPQELLLGSYPYVSCSQPGDRAHRCFAGDKDTPMDFIIAVPLLGSLPQDMGQAVLDRFLLEAMGSLGQPQYEQQLLELCPHVDLSRCLTRGHGA